MVSEVGSVWEPPLDKVKTELAKMEELNIIQRVTEATEWCSPIVVAPKKNGSVRICVDFTKLNSFVVRERMMLPSTDECLAKLNGGVVFSKLDARMGFWQIPLAEESRNLTTFLTPFGRYRFTRLPFGICSAPEHFQRRLAQDTVWWPGISNDIAQKVADCYTCMTNQTVRKEPLICTKFPDLPWSLVGCDFLKVNGKTYLVIQDYYSRFLEIIQTNSTNAHSTIHILKNVFSRFGVPHTLRCDNGPPFDSQDFRVFARDWGFIIKTSSPNYPQSNGLAESAVATAKKIILKCKDLYEGLLIYRSTPLENGYSPSELLMGRKLRGTVPIAIGNLIPKTPDSTILQSREERQRASKKQWFDRRFNTKEKDQLKQGQTVYVRDKATNGKIVRPHTDPRSYIVETDGGGLLRRNRIHLTPFKKAPIIKLESPSTGTTSTFPESEITTNKRNIKPPQRLNL